MASCCQTAKRPSRECGKHAATVAEQFAQLDQDVTIWNFLSTQYILYHLIRFKWCTFSISNNVPKNCLMLATVNKLLCVFFRFSITIHPITGPSAHNEGKEHFIQAPDSGSRIRHALLFLPRVVQSISIESPALLKRLKTIPSRVACQESWPNFFRKSRSLVSKCCNWSDYVFHLPVTTWPIVFCMSQEHRFRCKFQRMSFPHAPIICGLIPKKPKSFIFVVACRSREIAKVLSVDGYTKHHNSKC